MQQYRIIHNVLSVIKQPIPQPGPGEILVRIRAVSLNFRDHNIVSGNYPGSLPNSFVPVSDGAGEIAAIGKNVFGFKKGDRVMTHFLPAWRDGLPTRQILLQTMGAPLTGVLSEYAVVSANALIHIPSYLTYEEASTLPVAALTAWQALTVVGQITAADTVVIQGTGGVALFALQFAKMQGSRVIITSSSDDKLEKAKALGADEILNYKQTPDWELKVLALTDGQGADVVLDVAGMTLNQSIEATRTGGVVASIGLLNGYTPKLNIVPLMQFKKSITGVTVGSYAMLQRMIVAMELHKMHPVISDVFAFSQAPQAFARLATGGQFGKIVIKI